MTKEELLIQRFVDHDLTPEERLQFLKAVDEDAALRRQWLNMELILAAAAQLPRLAPSPRFVEQVRAKVAARTPNLWERLSGIVMAPRIVEWNLAGAFVAASLAAVALWGVIRIMPERVVGVPVAAVPAQTIAASADQEPKVFVRMVLRQPGARSVSVAGDFNGWNPTQTQLERSEGGVWTATIPLKPGRYQYMFVIDGKQWIADPLAAEGAGDGFGAQNAVLDVAI
jgi:hypothetical protein